MLKSLYMAEVQSDFQIPPEMQGHCDVYLSKLESRKDKFTGTQNSALQRAIDYFQQNPEALLKDTQYYLDNHPEYLGVSPEDVKPEDKTKARVAAQPPSYTPEKIGPIEQEIMDDIFERFSSTPEDEIIEKARKGKTIKGSRS